MLLRMLLLAGLVLTLPVHAEIYKWIDERGNVHFSDEKPARPVQTIVPDTGNTGVQLSPREASQQWKDRALQAPPASAPASAAAMGAAAASGHPSQEQDHCAGKVGACFTKEQDHVCKLRYGKPCVEIYHWKVCLQQQCQANRLADRCESPFYYLDQRPVMLGPRDLGRPLPIREWVSADDWACLSRHGFFCDEVVDEAECQSRYRHSCADLQNWPALARERCVNARDGDCDSIDSLIRYRPAPLEEVKKVGTLNAQGRVVSQDLLLQALGVQRNDPRHADMLERTLRAITGLNLDGQRQFLDCERRWQH